MSSFIRMALTYPYPLPGDEDELTHLSVETLRRHAEHAERQDRHDIAAEYLGAALVAARIEQQEKAA